MEVRCALDKREKIKEKRQKIKEKTYLPAGGTKDERYLIAVSTAVGSL